MACVYTLAYYTFAARGCSLRRAADRPHAARRRPLPVTAAGAAVSLAICGLRLMPAAARRLPYNGFPSILGRGMEVDPADETGRRANSLSDTGGRWKSGRILNATCLLWA